MENLKYPPDDFTDQLLSFLIVNFPIVSAGAAAQLRSSLHWSIQNIQNYKRKLKNFQLFLKERIMVSTVIIQSHNNKLVSKPALLIKLIAANLGH